MASFEAGLSLRGKNFFKIQRDYLQHKDLKEIVEYYYLVGHNNNYFFIQNENNLVEKVEQVRPFLGQNA